MAVAQLPGLSDSIRVSLQAGSLEENLRKISDQSGYTFAYRSHLLDGRQSGKLVFTGTFRELFSQLFDPQQLCYTLQHNQVILHTACRPKHYTISGGIVNASDHESIPYVSVSLPDASIGVIADHEGIFEITLPWSDDADTLIFSSMGYIRDTLVVKAEGEHRFYMALHEKLYALDPAIIRPEKYEIETVGNQKEKSMGSLYLDTHGQQTALLVANDRQKEGTFESVSCFLSKKGNTNAPFRVRLYAVDTNGLPGRDLIEDAIVVKPHVLNGWYRIDLLQEQITFPASGAFIAIEGVFPDDYDYYYGEAAFVDLKNIKKANTKLSPLSYGQRLGYNKKYRKETWHYSINKVWFQLEKQAYGAMISATIKYVINTDNYDQENE
jgi:hypothetical protein